MKAHVFKRLRRLYSQGYYQQIWVYADTSPFVEVKYKFKCHTRSQANIVMNRWIEKHPCKAWMLAKAFHEDGVHNKLALCQKI